MKIVVVGNFAQDSFGTHIFDTLIDMGHAATPYSFVPNTYEYRNYISYAIKKQFRFVFLFLINFSFFRKLWLYKFFDTLKKNRPDLVIITHDYFWPVEISKAKKICNSKIILWFPDAIVSFGKAFFLVSEYDYYFFKDPYIVKKIRTVMDKPVFYLPECFNPRKHYFENVNEIQEEFKCDLTCVGNFHSWRSLFFEKLSNYSFKFYGVNPSKWMNKSTLFQHFQGYPVFNQKKAEAFLGAKIVINNLHYGEICGLNARAFEIAGIGSFQLIDFSPGLNELFEDEKEIVSFKSVDDLIEKINFWLKNEEGRQKIAKAGKERAYKDHTYEKRLNVLIETVFNGGSGYNSSLL